MTLSNIDELYKDIVSELQHDVRIVYCNKVIDKAQFVLEITRRYLGENHKKTFTERIRATQKEFETNTKTAKKSKSSSLIGYSLFMLYFCTNI